jgi:hypothetical protein
MWDRPQRDPLCKASVALATAVFERLVRDIEGSISRFRSAEPTGGSRNAHGSLQAIWLLAHEDDPPLGVLRTRIKALPKPACAHLLRRRAAGRPPTLRPLRHTRHAYPENRRRRATRAIARHRAHHTFPKVRRIGSRHRCWPANPSQHPESENPARGYPLYRFSLPESCSKHPDSRRSARCLG